MFFQDGRPLSALDMLCYKIYCRANSGNLTSLDENYYYRVCIMSHILKKGVSYDEGSDILWLMYFVIKTENIGWLSRRRNEYGNDRIYARTLIDLRIVELLSIKR